ncbi:uncharacterized protein GGS22DRAFT_100501 [Annulohypoxylon maeteangense]|uniref:uncharacterized protein n=1 Tax=Annulohypoxylon maeteangense TaxID=1927788 RepID=UPI002007F7DC|nr:uncharacterized protein GGS22DRAFT_100501 [Annulohypoxylon maeteangense]KAI0880056.1 hypothetical protein GGS22DRAFT_100501 [Annulohypoxylon maeteangense]
MIREEFNDDCDWEGGNVISWRSTQCKQYGEEQTLPDPVDIMDLKCPEIKSLNKENLSEFEALMLGEISNDGSSEDELDIDTTTCSSEDDGFFPFMDLPLEIRQQIYHWIHLMNPVRLTQFAPWYPIPVNRGYFVQAITAPPSNADTTKTPEEDPGPVATGTAPLLSPWRPYSCMPSSMLRVSKQIYYESRELPFRNNEFVFVNWFASGLWAARSFVKGLQSWQMQTMHYARLELLSRDLAGRHVDEWKELCGAWSKGLRGLRLKILSSGGGGVAGGGVSWVVAGSPQRGAPTAGVRDEEGKIEEWVENGLKQLKKLRCLEVELSAADWDENIKLEWCRSLEEALNESKTETEQYVRVCSVERARDL